MNPASHDVAACTRDVSSRLAELIELQRPYVARLCSSCPAPCCTRVGHLFDEKDIIYLKLTGQHPDLRKRAPRGSGCAHYASAGCTLAAPSRPFTCHRYLCERLKADMMKVDPRLLGRIQRKLDLLDDVRGRLWVCYLETA